MYFLQIHSRIMRCIAVLLSITLTLTHAAYDLDLDSTDSIKEVAGQMAEDLLSFYHGDEPGGVPGLLPEPYYWWETGAMMGALIEYWYYTGDDKYVDLTKQAMLFQVGDENDYMPRNQTMTEGNDDQGFWALSAMAAAEYNFPHPEPDQPQWLALAQAVFNTQAPRWDTTQCGGGLRWQIFTWNKGWDYKNSISQGTFFALGARLALFTGNSSYADWATKTWEWMEDIKFIDAEYGYVYDGAHIPDCTNIVPYQFSYNSAVFINGAAAMYNYTEDPVWKDRLDHLLEGAKVFFSGNDSVMTEVACETVDRCNIDQQSFKAYMSRWLASITKWAPYTYDMVMPWLRASAAAAARQCVGGANSRMCGLKWSSGIYDGTTGVGQQMAAMEVVLSTMIAERGPTLTAHSGGTSQGDPGAGGTDIGRTEPPGPDYSPVTAADRAGAAILTAAVIAMFLAGIVWMFLDETSDSGVLEQMKDMNTSTAATLTAFVPAAGAAAVLRKKGAEKLSEKGCSTPDEIPGSEKEPATTTLRVSRVYNVTNSHTRRPSNMPLGWPHNPSLRGSALYESFRSAAASSSSSPRIVEDDYGGRGGGGGTGSVSPIDYEGRHDYDDEIRPISR